MSKKYQYRAMRRGSLPCVDTKYTCRRGASHKQITCKCCIHRVGVTREKQQRQEKGITGPIRYNDYLCF